MGNKEEKGKRSSKEKDRGSQSSVAGIQAGRDVRAGRDIAGGDIAGRDMAGRDITIQAQSSNLESTLAEWKSQMEAWIDSQTTLSQDEQKDLKEQVAKIKTEAAKGEQADASRLERLINTLAVIGPDIFEVAVTTLANPLAGIGLVLKKIGDRAKLERAS
jgi:hypothetical protein